MLSREAHVSAEIPGNSGGGFRFPWWISLTSPCVEAALARREPAVTAWRILKPGGRLLHYTGGPGSRGRRIDLGASVSRPTSSDSAARSPSMALVTIPPA